ncbi:MAG: FAD-dependent oxidoreductase [Bacilli bacterium]
MENKDIIRLQKKISKLYKNIKVSSKEDCVVLKGELDNWSDIVNIGLMAASTKKFYGVINEIKLKGYKEAPMRISDIKDNEYDGIECDVLIVGGGIIGSAILHEFSKYNVNAILIEKENDLALQASSRNDGCIHVGIDLSNKSKKWYYLNRSLEIYEKLANDLKINYRKDGQTIVFTKNFQRLLLPFLKIKAKENNIKEVHVLNKKELEKLEPNTTPYAKFAVKFGNGAVICPYNMTIALAENAVLNGGKVFLETSLLDINMEGDVIKSVVTNRGTIYPKVLINAAGVFSDKIAKMANDQFFTIHPRKGTNAILDKKAKRYLSNSSIAVLGSSANHKTSHSKGGGVVPTIDYNPLVGPTAHETPFREDFTTDIQAINEVMSKHVSSMPKLSKNDIITYFSGIRAATYEEDFIVQKGKWTKNIVHAAGIQSPGITAAPAIAEDIVKFTQEVLNTKFTKNPKFSYKRGIKNPLRELDNETRNKYILENPDYGQIICRCEEISKGEVIDALNRPIPVNTISGIKRRVRAGMGRCQGSFCEPQVLKIISENKGISLENVKKKGNGKVLVGDIKDGDSNG